MTTTITCRDLGGFCDYAASGTDKDGIARDLLSHMEERHGEAVANMSQDDKQKLLEKVERLFKERRDIPYAGASKPEFSLRKLKF
jgi:predicted small metal-binding protein